MLKIVFTPKEKHRFKVISDLLHRKLVNRQAAVKLQLSVRQIQRIKVRVRLFGAAGVVHGLKGKPSNHQKNRLVVY